MQLRFGYLLVLFTAATLSVLSKPSAASLTAYDDFGPSFPIYANSGTGFSDPWTKGGFNTLGSGFVLSNTSLQKTSGGSVCGVASPEINGAVRDLQQSMGAPGTTVYLSFLMQPQGTLNEGLFGGFFGVTLNGSLGNNLFIGKSGGGAADQYVLETQGGGGQAPSGSPVSVGHTSLLVLKAEFVSGDDVFTLYVNPKKGQPEPSAGAVKTGLDLGDVSTIGIYASGAFCVDEIRIGTTYGDVVPAIGGEAHENKDHENKD
jgi:hypothetical protein